MRDLPLGRLFGIPLRAQPSALLILAILVLPGVREGGSPARSVLFAAVVFGSILIHELGHALVGRRVGLGQISITLHGFGGYTRFERPPGPRAGLLVTFAGPAASLLLSGLAFGCSMAVPETPIGHPPAPAALMLGSVGDINLFWGLFNLLPMLPLDGGLLTWHGLSLRLSRERALRWAARLGVLIAIGLGTYAYVHGEVFFGVLALLSLMQTLPVALEPAERSRR